MTTKIFRPFSFFRPFSELHPSYFSIPKNHENIEIYENILLFRSLRSKFSKKYKNPFLTIFIIIFL